MLLTSKILMSACFAELAPWNVNEETDVFVLHWIYVTSGQKHPLNFSSCLHGLSDSLSSSITLRLCPFAADSLPPCVGAKLSSTEEGNSCGQWLVAVWALRARMCPFTPWWLIPSLLQLRKQTQGIREVSNKPTWLLSCMERITSSPVHISLLQRT